LNGHVPSEDATSARGVTEGRKVKLPLYMACGNGTTDLSLQVNDQLHTPVALSAERHHRYPISTRLDEPYGPSDTLEVKR